METWLETAVDAELLGEDLARDAYEYRQDRVSECHEALPAAVIDLDFTAWLGAAEPLPAELERIARRDERHRAIQRRKAARQVFGVFVLPLPPSARRVLTQFNPAPAPQPRKCAGWRTSAPVRGPPRRILD